MSSIPVAVQNELAEAFAGIAGDYLASTDPATRQEFEELVFSVAEVARQVVENASIDVSADLGFAWGTDDYPAPDEMLAELQRRFESVRIEAPDDVTAEVFKGLNLWMYYSVPRAGSGDDALIIGSPTRNRVIRDAWNAARKGDAA